MANNFRVGILGATGMVGQRFVTLLEGHPWFTVVEVAASPRSAGKSYEEAVEGRWAFEAPIPDIVRTLTVREVETDKEAIAETVDIVFCALDLDKESIRRIEEQYAALGVAVISNNSAHRWTADVPMLMPEVNPEHVKLIDIQRANRGWDKGLIAVKPNCSIQSYVSVLTALKAFGPREVHVTSMQAISGAGKTFATWPEMVDNVNPYIAGEEEKSEREPLKIWGALGDQEIILADIAIQATCVRVPVSDGHMAAVSVAFDHAPTHEEFIRAITTYDNPIARHSLPSAPSQLMQYLPNDNRPQTRLDRDYEDGMGISVGRLRDSAALFDLSFVSLSHNTIRGAAGGAILMAELLVAKGYITH